MELGEYIVVLSRLGMGAVGTFFAILLWSHTREVSWVLVVVGTLISYAEIVLATLERFGILAPGLLSVAGFPVLRIALVNLPMFFYTVAFITVIARQRVR